jgi:dipeptidyl aminopeptidase/acylaminoacyl peptidase
MQHINNPGKLGQIEWSPDGKHLAMNSAVDINDPQEGHLMIAAVPGDGSLRDLTPDIEGHVESFAWQDAETLMYVADRRQATPIESVALDGKKVERYSASDVVFSGLSASGDGQTAAMLGQNGKHPAELFLLSASDSQPRKLTDHNPWLSERRFAEQEVVRWRARDGLELEGVLIYPLNFTSGHRYPLIMLVHGGPESHIANRWLTSYSYPGQVGAARGFAVFHPNYRGSTGRGVEFSKLGQADAAGKEFDDLVDGVDHLVNIGLVDKDRVGITGGSYGGYASAWGATYYSDRFAASVMFVGISDNVSKLGTTDIPEEMYLVHHRKRLWDDWDYFLDRSPLRHVQKNRTPTLILHGKQDPRVHPSQSLELFRHLKTLKQAPARLVLYEGEGHGNRKAAARLDYNLRLLRWMEHYLQGAGGESPPRELDYRAALQSGE